MTNSPLLSVEHVSKDFGDVVVLRDVSLVGESGEILAIVGENGAGKSTLMRILAGVIPAGGFAGTIRVGGAVASFSGTHAAEASGVVMIPQELAVIPEMSVAENLLLNREPTRFRLIDTARMLAEARSTLTEFGLDIDPTVPMKRLGVARQQLVEIAKALSKRARILILDEPTAPLTQDEADRLFERLRHLKKQGYLCLYISHRIDEVLDVADRVVVLRDGAVAGIRPASEVSHDALITLMLGRSVAEVFPTRMRPELGDVALSVRHLAVDDPVVEGRRLVDDVSLEVRAGEIVGIFGLVGAGRTELVSSIFGFPPGPSTGSVEVRGQPVRRDSPRHAIAAGVALVTEDRRRFGFVPDLGIKENTTLVGLAGFGRWGLLHTDRETHDATNIAHDLGIRAPSVATAVRTLSGGNQQKVVVAKWLVNTPSVLILDEPTRGIDVGAKVDLYRLLSELADQGVAVLLVSSELTEITGLADRILVMSRGRLVGERQRSHATDEELLRMATGVAQEAISA